MLPGAPSPQQAPNFVLWGAFIESSLSARVRSARSLWHLPVIPNTLAVSQAYMGDYVCVTSSQARQVAADNAAGFCR